MQDYQNSNTGKDGAALHLYPETQMPKHRTMAEEMKRLADLITANIKYCTKEVLTSDEAARYLGISKSYLYKLSMKQQIPHYKPMGKLCYFNRVELEQWLQSNKVLTLGEVEQQAQAYNQKKGVLK